MEISDDVIAQVSKALNIAIGITLVHAKDQNATILVAAQALDDAINAQPAPRRRRASA